MLRISPVLKDILDAHAVNLTREEGLETGIVLDGIAAGTMVLLANPAHAKVSPLLVGQPSRIKVNANIGTSPMQGEVDEESRKLAVAAEAGADTVMDLSTAGDLDAVRRRMIENSAMPLGTVPIYAVMSKAVCAGRDAAEFEADDLLAEIARQAAQGVDFMTIHSGVTLRGAELARGRVLGVVSRGGSVLARWMRDRGRQNPLYERFDDVLDILRGHNVVLSLGDGLRPGALADAGDAAQWEEIVALGELARRAREAGVQAMIEGPGHVPLPLIESQIRAIKRATDNAPLYVLGPLPTDTTPGYDHIAGAVGGALAAWYGADFLCYVTPAEHLTLPDENDVRQGIMASRVAARCADAARDGSRDKEMSRARARLDWQAVTSLAVDPELVKQRRGVHAQEKECAMCGKYCAIRMLEEK